MWRVKYYYGKLKYRLTNLRGPMDYIWLAITIYNIYGVYAGLVTGNMTQVVISALFLALCLQGLFR
jgi:hypothetical protein